MVYFSQRGTRADSLRCAYAQRVVEAGLPEDRDHGPELREGPQRQGRADRGEVQNLRTTGVSKKYKYFSNCRRVSKKFKRPS